MPSEIRESFWQLAQTLADAEEAYRKAHDLFGDGNSRTGRAWDRMRRCGDRVREAGLPHQSADAELAVGQHVYRRIEQLMDAKAGTPECDELQYLARLAEGVEGENAILAALAENSAGVGDDVVEAMARAHDREEAAQKGEPSPWDVSSGYDGDFDAFYAERMAAMRAALAVMPSPTNRTGETDWVTVPREPTEEMLRGLFSIMGDDDETLDQVFAQAISVDQSKTRALMFGAYRAMLAAAPVPFAKSQNGEEG